MEDCVIRNFDLEAIKFIVGFIFLMISPILIVNGYDTIVGLTTNIRSLEKVNRTLMNELETLKKLVERNEELAYNFAAIFETDKK